MVLAPIPPTLSQLDGDANALKSKANEEFNKGNYLAAARLYTLAIDLVTDNGEIMDSVTRRNCYDAK